ncbi:C8orf82, partial [Symbiodinium sp. CCMP2456]
FRRFFSETHWPDGTPKRFRGKDSWKNWINWDAPFRDPSDELNRQRRFFWEVDEKGALWRLELDRPNERFGQMRHAKVVDDFFRHLQRNRTGHFEDDFPFVSLKTHESYYARWAATRQRAPTEAPFVFNDLQQDHLVHIIAGSGSLAQSLTTPLEPSSLRLSRDGRLLHPVSTLRRGESEEVSTTRIRRFPPLGVDDRQP